MMTGLLPFVLYAGNCKCSKLHKTFLTVPFHETQRDKDECCVASVSVSAETDCILFQKDGPASPFSDRYLTCQYNPITLHGLKLVRVAEKANALRVEKASHLGLAF
jgi:hypothetical protein